MIINCPNCNKRFKINTSLIPVEGRDLKCGSCDHVWFYKIEDKNLEPLSLKEDIINNEDKPEIVDKKIERTNEVKKSSSPSKIDTKDKKDLDKIADKQIPSKNKTKNTSGKFFSYIIVFIISFVAFLYSSNWLNSGSSLIFFMHIAMYRYGSDSFLVLSFSVRDSAFCAHFSKSPITYKSINLV